MEYQNELNQLGSDLCDLTQKYNESLPPYEIATRLIAHATSMMLYCAPSETLGMKTIMAAVKIGIGEYEEQHS